MRTLKQTEKVRPLSERGVYAYPVNRFSRDASDEDILSDYENSTNNEDSVRKYTVEEFLSCINDESFNSLDYWVRLI